MRKVYGGRSLLNLPGHHTTAAIVAEIDNTEDEPLFPKPNEDGYGMQPNITCRITDCDDAVNIDFDVKTANQLENSLYKVDVMVESLMALREGLIIEHHRLQDRLENHPNPSGLYNLKNAVGKRSDIKT
jgi:hypothetical protein